MLILKPLEIGGVQSRLNKFACVHSVENGSVRIQQPQGDGNKLGWNRGPVSERWIIADHRVRKGFSSEGKRPGEIRYRDNVGNSAGIPSNA